MIGNITTNPHLLVRDAGTPKGRGLFTRQDYRTDDTVETSPIIVINAPWDTLPREMQLVVYSWSYLAADQRTDMWALALGFGSLLNHSSEPNLAYSADVDRQAIVFRATRQIDAGEELTIDYNADIDPAEGEDWFTALGVDPVG